MNLLEKIITEKKKQVANEKLHTPVDYWEQHPSFERQALSLKQFVRNPEKNGIIAEFKRKSPSKGIINNSVTVIEVTSSYAKYGASGLSILTDQQFFGGSIDDLKEARRHLIPILRKDFVVDEYQIIQSKAIGADVILLIAACLTIHQVRAFAKLAKKLGMEALLEVHDLKEIDYITDDIELVGINNRDLKTFTVDVTRSINLAMEINKKNKDDLILISESGIDNIETIESLRQAGFDGFLIGENFMKEKDPAIAFAKFVTELKMSKLKNVAK